MPFRTHLGRSLDIRSRWNQAILAIVLITGVVALIRWLDGEPADVLLAPASAFVIWALGREIDHDHNWTALVASIGAAVWAFRDVTLVAVIAMAGLVGVGRLVSNTTGRRPLTVDLAAVTVGGIAIGFTSVGWAAGFALAIALYLDYRFAGSENTGQLVAAAATAAGTTIVAALTGAFDGGLPTVNPYLGLTTGAIALLILLRDPSPPTSIVDARHASLLDRGRVHAARVTVSLALLGMVLLSGSEASALAPAILMMSLAVISNEAELAKGSRS